MAESAATVTGAVDANPYSAPKAALIDADSDLARAEGVRRAHLNHEVSVKGIGALYYFSALVMSLAAVAMARNIGGSAETMVTELLIALLCIGFAAALGFVGYGLRRLRPWARIPSAVVSGLGMLAFPFGTLINGYFVYLMVGKKGRMVFSPEYMDAMKMTPHIKYRSFTAWVVLIAAIGVIALAIALPALQERF